MDLGPVHGAKKKKKLWPTLVSISSFITVFLCSTDLNNSLIRWTDDVIFLGTPNNTAQDTTRPMVGDGEVTVFADTNLGTRIAFNAPPDITAASLKSRFIKKNSFFSSTLHVLGLNIFPIWRFCWFCCVISLVTFASVWLHVFGLNNTVSLALIWNCCSDDDFEEEYVLWVMYIFCTCLCWEWGSFARV